MKVAFADSALQTEPTPRTNFPVISASDPCVSGTHDCHEFANCVPGGSTGYRCECKVGYRGDGYSCEGMQVYLNVNG